MSGESADGGESAVRALLEAFELHSAAGIRDALKAGASPVQPVRGKTPVQWLMEMYTRSARFVECLSVLLDAGASIDDPLLQAILLDDVAALRAVPEADWKRRFSLDCTYTSLTDVTALHICAEYNSVKCARALLDAGMNVDSEASVDGDGFGGHTPIFHTVNSNGNYCRPMMELLADAGARLDVRVDALLWGAGFEWETAVFDVTPISYAQCGLYFQFHRREADVFSNVAHLYTKRHGRAPRIPNVPNRYVDDARTFPPRT